MGESLIQRCRVSDEGLTGCKVLLAGKKIMTVPASGEKAPANSVPAAAVRRRGQALFGITGRKGRVGGLSKSDVKSRGSTSELQFKLLD